MKPNDTTKQKTTLRLPRELHKSLRRIAVEEEKSFESICERFLRYGVGRYYASSNNGGKHD